MGGWVTLTLATGSFNHLFFAHCDAGFQPSPKLTLGAPLRRQDARTTICARTRRGLGTGAQALCADVTECFDLGWAKRFYYALHAVALSDVALAHFFRIRYNLPDRRARFGARV